MQRFRALLASKSEAGSSLVWQELDEAELMDGDVTIRVSHSTVNYKDGLALTGKAPVTGNLLPVTGKLAHRWYLFTSDSSLFVNVTSLFSR